MRINVAFFGEKLPVFHCHSLSILEHLFNFVLRNL